MTDFYFQQEAADRIKFQDIEYLFEALAELDYPDDTYNEDSTFTGYFDQLIVTLRLELFGSLIGTRCNFTMTDDTTLGNHFWLDGVMHIWRDEDELYFFEKNAKRLTIGFGSEKGKNMTGSFDGPWVLLTDEERVKVWKKFGPITGGNFSILPSLPDFYTSKHGYFKDKSRFDDIFREIFSECMGKDDWMYILDWDSDCFRWNPRVPDEIKYPVMHEEKGLEDCEIWFPEFFTDGDFYGFLAKDFRWGWMTLNWREDNIWVWGEPLKKLIAEKVEFLELKKKENSNKKL